MRRIAVTIYWSAEEADTVYQFLGELREVIWQIYGQDIEEMYREATSQETDSFNDDLTF
ncbi:hypothetical protein L3Q72_17810 [Vibrio sp. JC009]|uniref:hypothetical protein n=1 Tax=Vibrio sp. JC009 TaxID=2912314 RepID=UPI0023B01661|nr:hypothetical protein [Vibrio sp. JC009]WED22030.1 hypothetical protein L3Q72_01020 [Vibrio sp. JC009]WED23235.1 hypothetical protein L3Q72_07545 [Vibrio sp. JC009]WED24013.1 hypothetical protein L3Q72_22545 [Vibrio sp. JC009]WED24732.1 hypothetical protein L3Q72_17810 [Vibrio sp. JC009]